MINLLTLDPFLPSPEFIFWAVIIFLVSIGSLVLIAILVLRYLSSKSKP